MTLKHLRERGCHAFRQAKYSIDQVDRQIHKISKMNLWTDEYMPHRDGIRVEKADDVLVIVNDVRTYRPGGYLADHTRFQRLPSSLERENFLDAARQHGSPPRTSAGSTACWLAV